jgi:hypothetical protein
MSESDGTDRSVPGVVIAAAVLLGFGGGLAVLGALLRGAWGSGVTWAAIGIGAGYLALAFYLYRGRRWAWLVTLVLSGIGIGLGLLQLSAGARSGLTALGAAVLYTVLLTLPPARRYFARRNR